MAMSPTGMTKIVRADEGGLSLSVSRGQLLEIGVEPGEAVVVEFRRATRTDWIAANASRIYESADAMDRAVNELRALGE